jgi:hypothetical protein
MSTPARGAVALCLGVLAASSSHAQTGRRCGTAVLTAEQRQAVEAATLERLSILGVEAARVPGSVSIPVWFHVVNKGTGLANGDLPTAMLDDQIDVMNQSFNGTSGGTNTPFRFYRAGVTRRTNATLFANCHDDAYRSQLHTGRVGGAETLNVYTCQPVGLFGWAYFPWWYGSAPSTDGMVLHFGTFPGSTWEPFNRGDTAVHEAGHWLGLYHTFEGGCSSTNDQVADTPAEATAHYGCPSGLDSCPSLPGLDPLRNFMSYFDDDCIWEFTGGQSSRMDTQHGTYRFGGTTTPRPTPTPSPTPTAPPRATPTPTPTPSAGGWVEITPGSAAVTASANDGNLPGNTVDGSLATRWSANGDGQWIRYDLGTVRTVGRVTLAVYRGNERRNRFDLERSQDGTSWTPILTGALTSGTTTAEQPFDFAPVGARYVRYVGHMNNVNAFNSLTEVSLFQPGTGVPTTTPTPTATPNVPVPTPTPTATPATGNTEITPGASGVTASTSDTNVAGNAVDNNLATRWSGNGDGAWLRLDLGATRTVAYVRIAVYGGNTRQNRFDLQISSDGTSWTNAITGGLTSGTTTAEETHELTDISGRYVRYVGHGSTAGTWNSLSEISIFGR